MSTRAVVLALAGAVALALTGCGEQPKVYKQGQYQGKPDTRPWDNAQFKGNQAEWENAIKARNQAQNEYSRSTPSAN